MALLARTGGRRRDMGKIRALRPAGSRGTGSVAMSRLSDRETRPTLLALRLRKIRTQECWGWEKKHMAGWRCRIPFPPLFFSSPPPGPVIETILPPDFRNIQSRDRRRYTGKRRSRWVLRIQRWPHRHTIGFQKPRTWHESRVGKEICVDHGAGSAQGESTRFDVIRANTDS
jgi:hypothetical protein